MSSFSNSNDNSLLDQSASGAAGIGELGSEETSRNTSRASSTEKDDGQCAVSVTTRRQWQQLTKPGPASASVTHSVSSTDEDSNQKGGLTMVVKRQPMRRAGSDASTRLTLALRRMNENDDVDVEDLDSHGSPVVPPIMRRSHVALARTDSTVSMDSTGSGGDTNGSNSRPVRTVVANAVAISEAQSDFDGDNPTGKKKGRTRKPASAAHRERNEKIAEGISGLDKLHEYTLGGIASK
jgi:hypothetical protein